jgi:hypothetical protein
MPMTPGESRTAYSRVCSIRDDGVYEFECPNGHRSITVLSTPKHEVLYTIGVNALLDGYLREALASFAASLERYYEFALRVIARHKGLETAEFDATWRSLSRQSERQFGAFVAVWLLETGTSYTIVSLSQINSMTSLRNEVIHQGKIPTLSECKEYGQYVFDIVLPIEKRLSTEYEPAYKDERFARAMEMSHSSSSPIGILSIYSAFKAAINTDRTLESVLKKLEEYRTASQLPTIGTEFIKRRIVTRGSEEPGK